MGGGQLSWMDPVKLTNSKHSAWEYRSYMLYEDKPGGAIGATFQVSLEILKSQKNV